MTRKAKQIAVRAIIVFVLSVPVLIATTCFIDSFNYPRIARSAYWRRPGLLIRATYHRLFPGKGVSAQVIAKHAEQFTKTSNLNINLLYLPDRPANDKTIKARVFCLIAKSYLSTNEDLFWLAVPRRLGRKNIDETVVYEYRTGKLICAEDYSAQLGSFALE